MRVRGSAMVIRDGKLLTLVYRYPEGLLHAIPGGGMEQGETLAAAIVREYREELGVEVALGSLRYVGDMMASPFVGQTVHVVFDAALTTGEPRINARHTKADGVDWLPLDRLDEALLYPAINQAILDDRGAAQAEVRYIGDCKPRHWA